MADQDAEYTVIWAGRGPLPGRSDDEAGWQQRERPTFPRANSVGLPNEQDKARLRRSTPAWGKTWSAAKAQNSSGGL
jgi:hypothetical protein